jgi:chaperonin GroES
LLALSKRECQKRRAAAVTTPLDARSWQSVAAENRAEIRAPVHRGAVGTTGERATHSAQEGHPLATATETTKLRPLGDRVVIKPSPREEITKSGIVLPDTAKEKPQEGSALAVGPGRILDDGSREKMDVAVGDKVLYAKYAGTEFKVNGEDLLIVSQKDILAIVEG